jgi:hypothetical protein
MHNLTRGWVWFAITIAVFTIGSGWTTAWYVDRNADLHWADLVTHHADDITHAVYDTVERDRLQLYAFARSLPEGSERDTMQFDAIFALEAASLNRRQDFLCFDGLAYAVWVPADDKEGFASRYGVSILDPNHLPSDQPGEGFVVLHASNTPNSLFTGLDLTTLPQLADTVSQGFQLRERPTVGASYVSDNGFISPIAVRQGDQGVVLGLLNLSKSIKTTLAMRLPDGISVTIKDGNNALYQTAPIQNAQFTLTTNTQIGSLDLTFDWNANTRDNGDVGFHQGQLNSVIINNRDGAFAGLTGFLIHQRRHARSH